MIERLQTSQEILHELLDHLDITAYRLAIELGHKNNMKIQHVKNGRNKISKKLALEIVERYPKISLDYLRSGVGYLVKGDKETTNILINTNGNIFTPLKDGGLQVTVKLVPFYAYASYIEAIDNISIMNDWQDITFNVDKYGRGNYLGFEIKNDSMNGGRLDDTPSGAFILGRELGRHHWLEGFNPSRYGWIILSQTNIFHKDIIALDKAKGTITCHSRNPSPEFSDFELNLNDIYQIFKVIKRTF
ncbi:CIA30 family protein [Tenacibaculum amylolyticum]|uniref:hypothetical protein n=1 Tax=Tenacibaculum amylolyticum TaxID=104269 RepID=UPI0038B47ECA